MRALILAAGLGTRLRPLTDNLPKPLVPVRGRPMVEYVLDLVAKAGVKEALLNVHYLPEKMEAFVAEWNRKGLQPRLFVQNEKAEILGSGGAVALAADWLFEKDEAALMCNSDVLGSPDLRALAAQHAALVKSHGVECTISVMKHPQAGVKFTGLKRAGDLITSFEKPQGKNDPELWHFPGYYMMQKSGLKRLPKAGTSFSIVDASWKPLAEEGKLGAWTYTGAYHDLGTVEDLRKAEAELA